MSQPLPALRIGLGIDVHRLEAGRPCVLGGVELPSAVGPVGHSDADVVLHALADACLGAAGLDDLGSLFPDDDPAHAGRDSRDFVREAVRRLAAAGWRVVSADIVVEAERPRLREHRAAIRASMAELLATDAAAVNLKGKSGEGVGAIGRGEAIRATATVLLAGTGGAGGPAPGPPA